MNLSMGHRVAWWMEVVEVATLLRESVRKFSSEELSISGGKLSTNMEADMSCSL